MLIDHKQKWIYTAIPKTASKSISCAFGHTKHPEPAIYHATIRDIITAYPETIDYKAWAVVRNPFSRLVSCYFDFTLKRVRQYSETVQHDKPLLSEFKDFQDFCLRLGDSPWKDDIFFKPQREFVKHPSPDANVWTIHYEYLEEEFNQICDYIGVVTPTLSHQNDGIYDKKWRSYYVSTAQVEAVRKLYHLDLNLYGYDF